VTSEDYESPEQLLSESIHKKALELSELQTNITGEKYDLGELFVRILAERDWTDKLGSILGNIRNRFRLRNTDTKLSLELRELIPDMNEVAKAYDEMTSGYKEFIRTVLRSTQRWREDE